MSNVFIFLKGTFVGIANIIPGLSGGTVAVIFGIYEELIQSISNFLKFNLALLKQSLVFLFLVILGALSGIFLFSFLIDWLLINHSEPLSYFFIGVLLSSIPYILKKKSIQILTKSNLIICIFFIGFGLALIYLRTFIGIDPNNQEISNLYLIISSFFAASTMIVPGISGSLVLVLFGTYSFIITSIKTLNLLNLLIISLSSVFGIVTTSFFIKKALDNYYSSTMSAIIGLMLGTIPGLYVSLSVHLIFYNALCLISGLFLVWVFDYLK